MLAGISLIYNFIHHNVCRKKIFGLHTWKSVKSLLCSIIVALLTVWSTQKYWQFGMAPMGRPDGQVDSGQLHDGSI